MPWMTLGNWVSPCSQRQVLAAAASLNIISRAVSCDSAPLVRTVRCRTVANTLSIGLDVRCGLALQLLLSFQVRASCGGLMRPAPERPDDDVGGLDATSGQAGGDASEFLDRPADEGLAGLGPK